MPTKAALKSLVIALLAVGPAVAAREGVTVTAPGAVATTPRQTGVLRDFATADSDHDGSLSRAEFADFMQNRASDRYAREMHQPEVPGADARGPRDRSARDEQPRLPLAADMTDPTRDDDGG